MKKDSDSSDDDEEHKGEPSAVTMSPPQDTNAAESRAKKKNKKKKPSNSLVANLAQTKYSIVKKVTSGKLGMKIIRDASSQEWDLYWTDNAVTPEQLGKLKPHQKINHFPGMFTLSRKNYLARNLIKMEKKFPAEYNFFPKTWVLPSELSDLRLYFETEPNAVVIAKPQASCQGRGIFLSKSTDDFEFGEQYVVQKYMKKPFIIDSLKFDLRIYVLVAGCDPLRVYIYKEGLARFATEPYVVPKKDNLNNLFMHLTNYAINKNSEKFEFNEDKNEMDKGHKRSLTATLRKIRSLGHDDGKVWHGIKDCISKTLISAQPLLAHHYRSCQSQNYSNNMCFQILGFDVLLDQHLKPEILEVNYTPSFSTDTPLDKQIKQSLILDSLNLMNLTAKAKKDIVNEKKKQMQERTLTGKKIYLSKQERSALVEKLQKERDRYEDRNLGNFERILPLRPEDESQYCNIQEQIQKYEEYLQYSTECYHQNTGANVKRNTKVIPASQSDQGFSNQLQEHKPNDPLAHTQQGSDFSQGQQPQQIYNQPNTKYTNTENLQKIYKSKFRPMLYKRQPNAPIKRDMNKAKNSVDEDQEEEAKQTVKSQKQFNKPFRKQDHPNPYKATTRASLARPQGVSANKPSREHDSQKGVLANKHRTISSMKRGLSNVYNITFQEKMIKNN